MKAIATSSTSRFLGAWYILWAAILGGALLASTGLADTAAPIILQATGLDSATLAGVEARVVSVRSSEVETVVQVVVSGRPDEGQTVNLLGRSVLRLADGTELRERYGESDGRAVTLYFDGIYSTSLPAALLLDGVALSDKPISLAQESDREMIGGFTLELSSGIAERIASDSASVDLRMPLGPGELIVKRIRIADGKVAIAGELAGFSFEQIQGLSVRGLRLTLESGADAALVQARTGEGETGTAFEFIFSGVPRTATAATLSVPYLDAFTGESAEPAVMVLTLPES